MVDSAAERTPERSADLPGDLLSRPPQEAARLLALRSLELAGQAARRLDDPEDLQALHDWRVALRRLRSGLRAWREWVDGVPKKLRRRLADLADSTNSGRDAEVQLDWLRRLLARPASQGGLAGTRRRGPLHLAERLAATRDREYERARGRGRREFARLESALRKRLSTLEIDLAGPPQRPDFAGALAGLAVEHAERLRTDLAAVDGVAGVANEAAGHRARISAKRLRYLLEPLRQPEDERVRVAPALIDRLKGLQDLLGEMHDRQVLIATVTTAHTEAAAERARQLAEIALAEGSSSPRLRAAARRGGLGAGLLVLLDRLREEQERRFAKLDRLWLGEAADVFFADLEALCRGLVPEPPAEPTDAEETAPPRESAAKTG